MIFTSQIFLFWFLPTVLALYYLAPRKTKSLMLVLASYVFYGWWRMDFVLLMVFSTIVDFICGGQIFKLGEQLDADLPSDKAQRLRRKRKLFLLASVSINLGLLGYFKYMNFGVDSLNAILGSFGYEGVTWTEVILPVGISFYTFQTMSYSIDVYRKEAPPVRTLADFACYVALFPQLVAGPIVRYQTVADQLRNRTHTLAKFTNGALLFQMGFIKKMLLADSVAVIADGAFGLSAPTTLESWLGVYAYSMQIYFDFSGYSDMAIGLGLMFGFQFPINFDSPYKSRSITEFWRRWHISLSTWLRDYLYIPLGGNQKGPRRTYINLVLTMLLGGLWHGAAWTFIAWGAYQGAWLAFERLLGKTTLYARLPGFFQLLLTFIIVLGGWVFFRATNFEQALSILKTMACLGIGNSWTLENMEVGRFEITGLIACAILVWTRKNSFQILQKPGAWVWIFLPLIFLIAVTHLFFSNYSPFLYFQF